MRTIGCIVGFYLLVLPLRGQQVALPEPPPVYQPGINLIYEFEVGGGESYYSRFLTHPEWPGAASGVTIGIGYDCGYNSRPVILSDWNMLRASYQDRLGETAGVKGIRAKPLARELRDVTIPWDQSTTVFYKVTVTRFWQTCIRTYPGFRDWPENVQWATLSLTFNRGESMVGDRRKGMRAYRDAGARNDYPEMAHQLILMIQLWKGTDIEKGMRLRRTAEANLILSK